jgi:hypothetical protein
VRLSAVCTSDQYSPRSPSRLEMVRRRCRVSGPVLCLWLFVLGLGCTFDAGRRSTPCSQNEDCSNGECVNGRCLPGPSSVDGAFSGQDMLRPSLDARPLDSALSSAQMDATRGVDAGGEEPRIDGNVVYDAGSVVDGARNVDRGANEAGLMDAAAPIDGSISVDAEASIDAQPLADAAPALDAAPIVDARPERGVPPMVDAAVPLMDARPELVEPPVVDAAAPVPDARPERVIPPVMDAGPPEPDMAIDMDAAMPIDARPPIIDMGPGIEDAELIDVHEAIEDAAPPRQPCQSHADCSGNDRCEDRRCEPPPRLDCHVDRDCSNLRVCERQRCVLPQDLGCGHDLDCSPVDVCAGGRCVPHPDVGGVPNLCRVDSDCDPDSFCLAGDVCFPDWCRIDNDCREDGEVCEAGSCERDPACPPLEDGAPGLGQDPCLDSDAADPNDDSCLDPFRIVGIDGDFICYAGSNRTLLDANQSDALFQGARVGASGERVFSYTPRRVERVRFSTAGSTFDTVLYVRRDQCGLGVEVAYNDDHGAGLQSALELNLEANVTYFIFVDGFYAESVGNYSLRITRGEPCALDD